MSRKLNKRLKKYMKRRSMPKRIAGVKVPKALRRAGDTELGAAIMAEVLVGAAGIALMSPAAKKLRQDMQKFAVFAAHSLSETAQGAAASIKDAFDHEEEEKPVRRTRSTAVAAH
jgi:uncharacterized membrane protein YadS